MDAECQGVIGTMTYTRQYRLEVIHLIKMKQICAMSMHVKFCCLYTMVFLLISKVEHIFKWEPFNVGIDSVCDFCLWWILFLCSWSWMIFRVIQHHQDNNGLQLWNSCVYPIRLNWNGFFKWTQIRYYHIFQKVFWVYEPQKLVRRTWYRVSEYENRSMFPLILCTSCSLCFNFRCWLCLRARNKLNWLAYSFNPMSVHLYL